MEKTNHSTTQQKQQNEVETIVKDVLAFGDLLLIANKGIGKTNSLMVLAEAFREQPNTRAIIFEDFPKWCLEFDSLPYFIVKDSDVVETRHTIDMENWFLRHERDYSVRRGNEIKEALKENRDLIFTMEINDIERSAFFIYSIVQHFYRKAYLRAYKNYNKHERIIFIIEESQNVFDSSTISKKLFNRLRKIFSVARNLDLHFVLASQRLQDLNTKIRGRTRLMLGNVSIDDYELKIRRLLRHSKYRKEILKFERGRFLYIAKDTTLKFQKFRQEGKPYEWKPKPKPQEPKKRSLFDRIFRRQSSVYDETEDLDSEIEEDALIGEELFEEEWQE